MTFTRIDEGTKTTLRIEGSLDAVSTPELRPTIEQLLTDGRMHVTVDLGHLRLIDSSGVGVIVSIYKRVRAAGGKVVLTGVRDQPLAIFKLLRLERLLEV
jgi:anti-sigma B factor antagonist